MTLSIFSIVALSIALCVLAYYHAALGWRVQHNDDLRIADGEHTAKLIQALIHRINQVDRLALELRDRNASNPDMTPADETFQLLRKLEEYVGEVAGDYVPRNTFYKLRDSITERVEILEHAIKHVDRTPSDCKKKLDELQDQLTELQCSIPNEYAPRRGFNNLVEDLRKKGVVTGY